MKRESAGFIVVVALSIAFALVSFLVFVTRGRNAALLSRKLRLGALLIGLTAPAVGCTETTCYESALPPNYVQFDAIDANQRIALGRTNRRVQGTVRDRRADHYSFEIRDGVKVVQSGSLQAVDGAFDEAVEEFEIVVSDVVPPGTYKLTLASDTPLSGTSECTLEVTN